MGIVCLAQPALAERVDFSAFTGDRALESVSQGVFGPWRVTLFRDTPSKPPKMCSAAALAFAGADARSAPYVLVTIWSAKPGAPEIMLSYENAPRGRWPTNARLFTDEREWALFNDGDRRYWWPRDKDAAPLIKAMDAGELRIVVKTAAEKPFGASAPLALSQASAALDAVRQACGAP